MKLASPQLERNLRDAVRRELRQSAELWDAYQRRRWQARRWTLYRIVWRFLIPPAAIFAPLCLGFPFVAALVGPRAAEAGLTESAVFTFGMYALAISSLLLATAGGNDRAYVSNTRHSNIMYTQLISLQVVAYLPISDREIRWPHLLWLDAAVATFAVYLWLAVPYGIAAWKLGFDVAGWVAAGAFAVLEFFTLGSALVAVCAFSPTRRAPRQLCAIVGPVLFFGTVLGAMIYSLGDLPGVVAPAFLWLTPFGWVSATFVYAYIGGAPAAWLILVPTVAFILLSLPLGMDWLRSEQGFKIKEFLITPSGWYGVIERGFRVPRELPDPPPLMPPKEKPIPAAEPLDAAAAGSTAQAAEYLVEPRWRPYQVLERVRDAALASRERLILRIWSGTYERLTVQWLVLVGIVALCVIGAAFVLKAPFKPEEPSLWTWPILFLVGVRFSFRTDVIKKWRPPKIACLPIGFREASRAAWKQEAIRALAAAPLVIAYGLIVATIDGKPAWHGLLHGLLPVLLLMGFQPVLDCLKLSATTNDTNRIRFWIFWLGGAFAVLIAMSIIIATPDLSIRYASVALIWLVSTLMWWGYDRAYRLGAFDLVSGWSSRRG